MAALRVGTWNVNGIRARGAQVVEWLERDRPDVACLQELKATREQVPEGVTCLPGWWCYWHGSGPYSGVSLQLSRERFPDEPAFAHPAFDAESRIVTAEVAGTIFASVYVPNGGKDYAAKIRFIEAMIEWSAGIHAAGRRLVLCGDINVAREERDVHPKERRPGVTGQRTEERALFERLLGTGLVDVGRALAPDVDDMYSWWAPWRNMRQRNIGWRLDYVLASQEMAVTALSCPVLRDIGTSDHAPVLATFG